jgi:cytochrome c oxidase assembly protein subunit 15
MKKTTKPVAIWIGIGVLMLLIQVILGGVTRLTGSGLSITEWNVITGTVPPLNEQEWLMEFHKYQDTPQYQLINTSFTLADFKFIFFWEWLHRLWARLIGVVFVVGFVYLLSTRYLKKEMIQPLLTLFVLGALQGAVGWIMVASGLTGDAVYVKPTRLAMHFIFAIGLIAYAFWFLLVLVVPKQERVVAPGIHKLTVWMILITVVQLIFGALMAGHKAANAAPTWPDINGALIPGTIFRDSPILINFIENKITIHFVHRTLAYLILGLTVVLSLKLNRIPSGGIIFNSFKGIPLFLIFVQVTLGIMALFTSTGIAPNRWGGFEWTAQFHQVAGMLFALSLVALLYVARRR